MSKELLKKAINNKILQYVFSRYFTYFIQFVNSILIAIYLGPYYLGVWGFVNLIIQYFAQFNFGITQSFNALGAVNKNDESYVSKLFGTTLVTLLCVGVLTILVFLVNFFIGGKIGEKYNFTVYAPYVCIIAILNYLVPAFLSLLRIYGNIITIAITQSLLPVLTFVSLHFFRDEALIQTLVFAVLFSSFLSLILCIIQSPLPISVTFEFSLFKKISKKGVYLFLYNTSFYFIILSTKSIVSDGYTVEEFGYFTFSFTLGNAILLLFNSFIFLIFPKIVNRLAHSQSDEVLKIVEKPRSEFMTLSHLVGHFAILLFPVFILFFPKYELATTTFNLIVMALIVSTQCFGFQELLIAREKDKELGVIAFISLLLNIIVASVFVYFIKVPFHYAIVATMIAYICFLILIVFFSRRFLKEDYSILTVLKTAFPARLFIPFFISCALSLSFMPLITYFIPIVIYVLMNIKSLLSLKNTFLKVLNKPEVIDI